MNRSRTHAHKYTYMVAREARACSLKNALYYTYRGCASERARSDRTRRAATPLSRRRQRADVRISVAALGNAEKNRPGRNHRHRIPVFSCKFAPLQPHGRALLPPLLRRVVLFCLRVLNSRRVAPRRPSPVVVASFVCLLLVRANG